jgi:hypothetical protein
VAVTLDDQPLAGMRAVDHSMEVTAVTAVSFPAARTSALVDNTTSPLCSPLHALAGETVTLHIQLTDLSGVAVPAVLPMDYTGAMHVHITPAPPAGHLLYKESNGLYALTFVPVAAAPHVLHIALDGSGPLSNSPLTVAVEPAAATAATVQVISRRHLLFEQPSPMLGVSFFAWWEVVPQEKRWGVLASWCTGDGRRRRRLRARPAAHDLGGRRRRLGRVALSSVARPPLQQTAVAYDGGFGSFHSHAGTGGCGGGGGAHPSDCRRPSQRRVPRTSGRDARGLVHASGEAGW